MNLELTDNSKVKGAYIVENVDTGEKRTYHNVITQNWFTNVFKAINGDPTADLIITSLATGDGLTPALKTNTELENELFRKNVTSISYTSTFIKITTLLAITESNFQIKEIGMFTSSGIISRVNVDILKNISTQYYIHYILNLV